MAPKRHSRRMVSFAGGPDASIEDMVGTGGGGGGGEVGSSPREEPRRAPRFPDRRRTYSTLIESTSDLEEKLNVANRTIEEMEADLQKAMDFGLQLMEDKQKLWEKMHTFEKQCQAEMDSKDEENSRQQNDLEALLEERKSLRERCAVLQGEKDAKAVQVIEMRRERDDLQNAVYKLQRDLSEHLSMLNRSREMEHENLKLKRELGSSKELNAELQGQIAQLRDQAGQAKVLQQSLKDADELGAEVFELRKQVETLEREKLDDMEVISRLRRMEVDNEELRKHNDDLKGKVASANDKYCQAMKLVSSIEEDLQYAKSTIQRIRTSSGEDSSAGGAGGKRTTLAEELGLEEEEEEAGQVEQQQQQQQEKPPVAPPQPAQKAKEEEEEDVRPLVDPAEEERKRRRLVEEAKAGLRAAMEADFRQEVELLVLYKERYETASVRKMSIKYKQLDPVEILKMCLAELHKFKEDLSRRATEARESSDVAPLLARMSELFVEIMLELSDRKIAYLESNIDKVADTLRRQEEASREFGRR